MGISLAALALAQTSARQDPGTPAKVAATRSDLVNLKAALEDFGKDVGRLPTTAEGLAALTKASPKTGAAWRGPYVSRLPANDAWGHPYGYAATGAGFAVASFGADGKPGGGGADRDLAEARSPASPRAPFAAPSESPLRNPRRPAEEERAGWSMPVE